MGCGLFRIVEGTGVFGNEAWRSGSGCIVFVEAARRHQQATLGTSQEPMSNTSAFSTCSAAARSSILHIFPMDVDDFWMRRVGCCLISVASFFRTCRFSLGGGQYFDALTLDPWGAETRIYTYLRRFYGSLCCKTSSC